MRKMRKFAWIFMAAMVVAGFSACSNAEDEPVLPGLENGSGESGNGEGGGTSTGVTGEGTQASPYTADDVIVLDYSVKGAESGPFYVKAYIVGQANGQGLNESSVQIVAPFTPASGKTQGTNLLIASNPDETDIAKMVPVELPSSGVFRGALNLPENPEMHKKEILIYGKLTGYFSVPGVKSPTYVVVDGMEYGQNPDAPVVEPNATSATVAEFLAAEVSKDVYYELTGTIGGTINTTYGNFDLTDGTGTVYVYGLTATYIPGGTNDKSYASLNLQAGDNITIRGYRNYYEKNQQIQVGGAYFVRKN